MNTTGQSSMGFIEILPMEPAHVTVVHEIFCENFSLPWSEATLLRECQRPDGMTFVAVCEGEPLGFLSATFLLDEANLNNIAVRDGYKRQGVGSALLCHFLETARRQRLCTVFLEVRASNGAAQQLYERHGFVLIGRRKNCYAHPTEDALLLSCTLTSYKRGTSQ